MRMTQVTYVSADSSTPWSLALDLGVRAQATSREAFPQLAVVLATSEHLVCLNDGVTSIKEGRTAGLQFHAIEDKLNDERVAVLGDQRLLVAKDVDLLRAVEVTNRDRAISERSGRVEAVRETVLGDETLRDDPEDLSPDFTDGVDTPVAGLVEGLVGGRVDSLIL